MPLNICLIRPPSPELLDDRIDPPIGLLQLAGPLHEAGHHVQLLDLAGNADLSIPHADVYGLTLYTTSYPEACDIRDRIRAQSDAPIIVGGPHAQALPELTAKDFDYVIVGEAETALPGLIDGLARRRMRQSVIRVAAPLDLSALPINNYKLLDMESYSRSSQGASVFSVLTGRGCPFRCAYCYTAALGGGIRRRSIEHIMSELEYVDETWGIESLRFIDDNFLMHTRFFRTLAPLLKDFSKPYRAYCRADDLSPQKCELLAESGCVMLACGVETGSQDIHNKMGTRKRIDKIRQGLEAAERVGISVRIGVIVGYPGETWETVRESARVLKSMPFDSYNLFNFVPLPGTDPFHHPERYGITWLSKDWKDYYVLHGDNKGSYAFEHETLDRNTLKEMRNFMTGELNSVARPSLQDTLFR